MIHDSGSAIYGAVMGTAGILAQVSMPGLPDDLKSWPVTAILGLVILSCLSLIAFQVYAAGKASAKAQEAAMAASQASIENAKAMTALIAAQNHAAERVVSMTEVIGDLGTEVRELIVTMRNRKCLVP
jgi:long-subunit fatty acid transport protein